MAEKKLTMENIVFKKAFKKSDEKYLLKLTWGEEGDVWATTTEAVYIFASNAVKSGDIIGVEYEEGERQYNVLKVLKTDQKTEKKESTQKTKNEPSKQEAKKQNNDYTTTTRISIERQTVMNATAKTMESLIGHVDPNNIKEIIETILKTYDEYVTK